MIRKLKRTGVKILIILGFVSVWAASAIGSYILCANTGAGELTAALFGVALGYWAFILLLLCVQVLNDYSDNLYDRDVKAGRIKPYEYKGISCGSVCDVFESDCNDDRL